MRIGKFGDSAECLMLRNVESAWKSRDPLVKTVPCCGQVAEIPLMCELRPDGAMDLQMHSGRGMSRSEANGSPEARTIYKGRCTNRREETIDLMR